MDPRDQIEMFDEIDARDVVGPMGPFQAPLTESVATQIAAALTFVGVDWRNLTVSLLRDDGRGAGRTCAFGWQAAACVPMHGRVHVFDPTMIGDVLDQVGRICVTLAVMNGVQASVSGHGVADGTTALVDGLHSVKRGFDGK